MRKITNKKDTPIAAETTTASDSGNNKPPTVNPYESDKYGSGLPLMTEEEMRKFVSVISNVEQLESKYIFNGFLFFLRSVREIIGIDTVGAMNQLFHLEEHIFHNLMWEGYEAYRTQADKAHLIFRHTEPYILPNDEGGKSENEDTTSGEAGGGLIEELEGETLALAISAILNNPNVPQKIHDALDNALCDTDGVDTTEINAFWKSPEYVAMVLRGHEKAEVSDVE